MEGLKPETFGFNKNSLALFYFSVLVSHSHPSYCACSIMNFPLGQIHSGICFFFFFFFFFSLTA